MTNRYWKAALVAGLVVAASAPSGAQLDLSSVLVGKWEGDVQMASGTYPRTLIIKSIQSAKQVPLAEAEYGGKGNEYGGAAPTFAPVNVALEAFGNDVILRFRTPEAWVVELTLYRDSRHLFGSMHIPISRGGAWGINPVKLTKVE